MKNPKIFAVAFGFYFFGDEVESGQEGFLCLKNASVFGGFGGGKGIGGVCRGDEESTVILDRFPTDEAMFPVSSVLAILPCINLYEFKGAELR